MVVAVVAQAKGLDTDDPVTTATLLPGISGVAFPLFLGFVFVGFMDFRFPAGFQIFRRRDDPKAALDTFDFLNGLPVF